MSTAGSPIVNGALVHQRWGGLDDGQLIAITSWKGQAVALAEALARDNTSPEQSWVVTDLSRGEQFYITSAKVAEADAKKQAEKS